MMCVQGAACLSAPHRAPLDWLEQTTTGQADMCLVNSKFTAGVFASTFTRLNARGVQPEVSPSFTL